jgi:hypothetical protein
VYKPVDWTVGTPARTLISTGTQVTGSFELSGASPREVRYRLDGSNVTSYIVYDDNGRAIKRVDLTGKAHGKAPESIPTPHVVEYKHNQSPTGRIFPQQEKTVRPATPKEIL